MVSTVSPVRGPQRIVFLCLFFMLFMIGIYTFSGDRLFAASSYQYSCHIPRSVHQETANGFIRQHRYLNLNDINPDMKPKKSDQHILILTTLQNDQDYLDNYFKLIDKSTYPNHLISIGLLISDSTDDTLEKLNATVNRLQSQWRNTFYGIDVFQKDFQLDKKPDDTSLNSKRATLARARNYLLTVAMKEHHNWIVWVDVKLYSYPTSIYSDLISVDEDVVVPNCLQKRDDGQFWAYDKNNWQESDMSLKRQRDMSQNEVLMEDYNQYSVGRHLLVDMPTQYGLDYKVPLDGVGTTFTLVRATVHREGAIFPPFVYQHELDTEGFGKMAKSMGFTIYGIPSYTIYHY